MSDMSGVNFDDLVPDSAPTQPSVSPEQHKPPAMEGADFDSLVSDEEKYGTTGQKILTGLEGTAAGIISRPGVVAAEKGLSALGVPGLSDEDIRLREETNPWTYHGAEAAGFAGSMLTGVGEAALLGKAGMAAAKATSFGAKTLKAAELAKEAETATKLAAVGAPGAIEAAAKLTGAANEAAKGVSMLSKVGTEATKQAVEMGILAAGDEAAKMMLHDPHQSAQSAIANIGLSSVLGGGVGGATPLLEAAIAPQMNKILNTFKAKANGSALEFGKNVEQGKTALDLNLSPLENAVLSKQGDLIGTAFERGKPEALEAVEGVQQKIADSVARKFNIDPESLVHYDKADAGETLKNAFAKEYTAKLEPIEKLLNKQTEEIGHINLADEDKYLHRAQMMEHALTSPEGFTATSKYMKNIEETGDFLLTANTLRDVVKRESELTSQIRKLSGSIGEKDYKEIQSLRMAREMLEDFREQQLVKNATEVAGKEGKELAEKALSEMADAKRQYASAAKTIRQANDIFGIGDFHGKETLGRQISRYTPEQIARKFSFKGDRDAIDFLQQHFPETFEAIKQNEIKEFLRPALMKGAKKGFSIDVHALDSAINNLQRGQNTYLQTIATPEAIEAVTHAKNLLEAMPDLRSSKTAKWTEKLWSLAPGSAIAMASALLGHGNPFTGFMIGTMADQMRKEVPDAVKLGLLKFLAKDAPVESKAFRSMVNYIDAVQKNEALKTKAVKNLIKGSAVISAKELIPSANRIARLANEVDALEEDPNRHLETQGNSNLGHYMDEHQTATSEASTKALQYLQSLKPKPTLTGPLDPPIPPSKAQIARYNRALTIAESPLVVLEHIKSGTLLASDIQDLHAMYPDYAKGLVDKMTEELANAKDKGILIPYKTRVSLSLFMGQPLDSTMTPQAIMATQPIPKPPQQPNQQKPKGSKSSPALGKMSGSYRTQSQDAEADRLQRH